jgi:hypothetical protein
MFMRTDRKFLEISRAVHCLWREPDVSNRYATAVSLHSHTMHSREGLEFIPRALHSTPLASAALTRIETGHRRKTGKRIPFERAFWRPPLSPLAAYDLECKQIRSLGLDALVSITDHDNLDACADLDAIGIEIPYSLEWTVPYHGTVFHIGIHNLPADDARSYESAMARVTAAPDREGITELLAAMSNIDHVLIVLNHPLSCEHRVPQAEHVRLLAQFLKEYGEWMHALELNGLQPAWDNIEVLQLSARHNMPVISGGDRHCCEPNACINLTNARTFADFIQEIRADRRSSVLFMPQYRDPIPARYIEFIWHAVREYPDFIGRERWVDRVFFERESGEIITCGSEWTNGGPAVVRAFVSVIGLLAAPGIRAMLCVAMGRVASLEPETL